VDDDETPIVLDLGTGALANLRRCPGAASQPTVDGSAPFVDSGAISATSAASSSARVSA